MSVGGTRLRLWAVILIALGGLVTFVLWSTSSPSSEEQLRRKVVRMARAAERREVAEIMKEISLGFRSELAPNRAALEQSLSAALTKNSWVRVFPVHMSVEVTGPRHAILRGTVVLGESPAEKPADLPKNSEIHAYSLDAQAVKEPDDEWRFIDLKSQPVRSTELF